MLGCNKTIHLFSVVGEFIDTSSSTRQVDLGSPQSFPCPAHQPSYGVSFTWIGKDQIQFKRNDRRGIAPNGDLFIMYVLPEDVLEINGLEGIKCTMSGANTFYSGGSLTLTTPQGKQKLCSTFIIEFAPMFSKIQIKQTQRLGQMKNDPCSCPEFLSFFNFFVSGFIAQLVRAPHRHREVTGSNLVEVLNFFLASIRNCINCNHSLFDFISAVHNMIYFI